MHEMSTINLLWICPACVYAGMLLAALLSANDKGGGR